jgi:hypothetical protein
MIYDGECGSFSDKIFDCFREIEADFRECVLKTVEEGELL